MALICAFVVLAAYYQANLTHHLDYPRESEASANYAKYIGQNVEITGTVAARGGRTLDLNRHSHISGRMKDKQTKERFMELRAQGFPLAKIAAEIGVSKTTLINWDRELKEEIDNLNAVELEALYDKFYLSTRKQVEFFGDILSRIQRELETRDMSEIATEKLLAMYAHFYREAQHALPELTFRNEDEIKAARAKRLPSSDLDAFLEEYSRPYPKQKKLTKS